MKFSFTSLLLLSIITFCTSCSQTDKAQSPASDGNQMNDTRIVNPELINEFPQLDEKSIQESFGPLEVIESHVIELKDRRLKLDLLHIKAWPDPGDLLKIQISENGNLLYETTNYEGWVKLGDHISKEVKLKNQLNSSNALLIDSKNSKQLILVGYAYASSPGLLTIIDLSPNPMLILNKEFYPTEISEIDNSGYRKIIGSTNYEDTKIINLQKMVIE